MSIDDTISQNELLYEQLQIVLEQEYKRLSLFHQLERYLQPHRTYILMLTCFK